MSRLIYFNKNCFQLYHWIKTENYLLLKKERKTTKSNILLFTDLIVKLFQTTKSSQPITASFGKYLATPTLSTLPHLRANHCEPSKDYRGQNNKYPTFLPNPHIKQFQTIELSEPVIAWNNNCLGTPPSRLNLTYTPTSRNHRRYLYTNTDQSEEKKR